MLAGCVLAVAMAAVVIGSASADPRSAGGVQSGVVRVGPASETITTTESGGEEQIAPGSTVHRAVAITNGTAATRRFDVAPAEVVGSSDGSQVEVLHGQTGGAAGWVKLEQTRVTVPVGESRVVRFTVQVPTNATAGSKPFGISVTEVPDRPTAQQAAETITIGRQTSIFTLELPGDAALVGGIRSSTTVVDGHPTHHALHVPLWGVDWIGVVAPYENAGERLLNPTGDLVATDLFGREVDRAALKSGRAYPGGLVLTRGALHSLPVLGAFHLTVHARSEAGETTWDAGWVVVVPVWCLAVIAGVIALVGWLMMRTVRRRNASDDDEVLEL